jgi:uncharacterized membrane protein
MFPAARTFLRATVTVLVCTVLTAPLSAEITGPNVQKGALVIPKAGISSRATFFPVTVDGVKMEILAVKASDGTIRTALNTCQVCFNSGRGWYVQQGDVLVCQNCGNRFQVDQIELQKNGCNPIPITKDIKTEDAKAIMIQAAVLEQAKPFFGRWKRGA